MEFWEFIDKHFVPIVTLIGTLGGAFIGNYISSSNQRKLFKEEKKAEEILLERAAHEKTIKIYNDFLEADGRHSIAGSVQHMEFQYEEYQNHIRPILYENISCLHDEVIDLVLKIDGEISDRLFFMEGPFENDTIIILYSELYQTIVQYIKKG